jgi:hypothetical protein
MIIIVDILLLRLKLDCDGGYDMAVKGLSIVVKVVLHRMEPGFLAEEEIPDDVDIGRLIAEFSSNAEAISAVVDME